MSDIFDCAPALAKQPLTESDLVLMVSCSPSLVTIYTPETKQKLPKPCLVTYFNLDTAKDPSGFKYYRNRYVLDLALCCLSVSPNFDSLPT